MVKKERARKKNKQQRKQANVKQKRLKLPRTPAIAKPKDEIVAPADSERNDPPSLSKEDKKMQQALHASLGGCIPDESTRATDDYNERIFETASIEVRLFACPV